MTRNNDAMTISLFDNVDRAAPQKEEFAPGAFILRGLALPDESSLLQALHEVATRAPFRHMVTPGGFRMSVAMTNCGSLGWITDTTGYRYDRIDPESGRTWPSMPPSFLRLAQNAATEGGFAGFIPDACLINRYEAGAKLSLHQDKDEQDFNAPIVSVSLGLPATFLFWWIESRRQNQACAADSR